MRPSRLGVLLAAALIASACGTPPASSAPATRVASPTAPRPDLLAREFAFEPAVLSLATGQTTFSVRNVGAIEHNFELIDGSGKTVAAIKIIAPGQTEKVSAALVSGTYMYVCTLPGHKDAGMVGTLQVR